MPLPVLDVHLEATPGVCGGRPRIAGRRITVEHVAILHERLGSTAEEIAAEYEVSLAAVYAALAYYHDHRDEVDDRIREGEAFARELQRRTTSPLAEKLRTRAAGP